MTVFLPLNVQESIIFGEHILFGVASFLHIIALVCLITQTPSYQAAIRNYLIYIQISLITMDVFVDLLTTPICLFPTIALYCLGPLCKIGMPPKIVVEVYGLLLGNTGISVGLCVVYKHQTLIPQSSIFKIRARGLLIFRIIISALVACVPLLFLALPSNDNGMDFLIDTYLIDISWIRKRGPYYFLPRTTLLVVLIYSAVLTKKRSRAKCSQIRRSLKILFAQLMIPLIIVNVPTLVMFIGVATETWLSFETCLCMYHVITLHSVVHNTLLLSVTPAYRKWIISFLMFKMPPISRKHTRDSNEIWTADNINIRKRTVIDPSLQKFAS